MSDCDAVEFAVLRLMSLGLSEESAEAIYRDYGLGGLDRAYQFALMGNDLSKILLLLADGVSVLSECLSRQAVLAVEVARMREKK